MSADFSGHTPGPWMLELVQRHPFGVRVMSGEHCVLSQHAYCFSTRQETRADNERGIGFDISPKAGITTRAQAVEAIAEQDANARLIAAAPTLYEFVASRAKSGDSEASTILEAIHGNAKGHRAVERREKQGVD